MTNSSNVEIQLERLADSIAGLKQDVDTKFEKLESKIEASDTKIEAYQKASNQVTNLAFGLIIAASLSIITAAITIIIPAVIKLAAQ